MVAADGGCRLVVWVRKDAAMKWVQAACAAAVVMLVLVPSEPVQAQEPSDQDLRKMYDDALVQLKAAQDRRSELAAENEKLTVERDGLAARVAELEQQLGAAREELAQVAEKNYMLRAHYAAWRQFVQARPQLKATWDAMLEASRPVGPAVSETSDAIHNRDWPISASQ
jgi:hypothetical protein